MVIHGRAPLLVLSASALAVRLCPALKIGKADGSSVLKGWAALVRERIVFFWWRRRSCSALRKVVSHPRFIKNRCLAASIFQKRSSIRNWERSASRVAKSASEQLNVSVRNSLPARSLHHAPPPLFSREAATPLQANPSPRQGAAARAFWLLGENMMQGSGLRQRGGRLVLRGRRTGRR